MRQEGLLAVLDCPSIENAETTIQKSIFEISGEESSPDFIPQRIHC